MNYQKIYDSLISKAKERGWTKKSAPCYCEKHHIVPKSMGGDNSKENLVVLTAKEHFVAHHLLWKIHDNAKMFFSLWAMMFDLRNNERIPFPEIPKIREAASKYCGKRGKDHHLYGVGHTDESRLKMSLSHKGKVLTKETRQRMSVARQGNTCQSKGVYKTPSGEGRSLRALAEQNGCSTTTVRSRCINNGNIVVSKKLPKEWRGKTWKELGWSYERD